MKIKTTRLKSFHFFPLLLVLLLLLLLLLLLWRHQRVEESFGGWFNPRKKSKHDAKEDKQQLTLGRQIQIKTKSNHFPAIFQPFFNHFPTIICRFQVPSVFFKRKNWNNCPEKSTISLETVKLDLVVWRFSLKVRPISTDLQLGIHQRIDPQPFEI